MAQVFPKIRRRAWMHRRRVRRLCAALAGGATLTVLILQVQEVHLVEGAEDVPPAVWKVSFR